MTKSKISPFTGIMVCLVFGLGVYAMIKKKIAVDELNKSHRFTIGKVSDHMYLSRGGEKIYYIFNYNMKDYRGIYIGNDLKTKLGRKYLIKFNQNDPKNSDILLGYEVLKSTVPPHEGWEKVPKYIFKR
jgi:hypothetical protein